MYQWTKEATDPYSHGPYILVRRGKWTSEVYSKEAGSVARESPTEKVTQVKAWRWQSVSQAEITAGRGDSWSNGRHWDESKWWVKVCIWDTCWRRHRGALLSPYTGNLYAWAMCSPAGGEWWLWCLFQVQCICILK